MHLQLKLNIKRYEEKIKKNFISRKTLRIDNSSRQQLAKKLADFFSSIQFYIFTNNFQTFKPDVIGRWINILHTVDHIYFPQGPSVPLHFIHTDYDNCACAYSCVEIIFTFKVEVFSIFTRELKPRNEVIDCCKDVFEKNEPVFIDSIYKIKVYFTWNLC